VSDSGPELRRLQRLLRGDPDSLQFVPLAELLRKDQQLRAALRVLEEGLKRRPGLRSARYVRAKVMADLDDVGGALAEVEELVPDDPDNVALATTYLELLIRADEGARARAQLPRLHALGVDPARLGIWARELDAMDRDLEVHAVTEPELPEDPFLCDAVAEGLARRGASEAALRAWEALSRRPEDARAAERRMARSAVGGPHAPATSVATSGGERPAAPQRATPAGRDALRRRLALWETR